MNKKIIKFGMAIILVTLLGCIGFTYYTRLKEPVFLTYCSEVSVVPKQDNYYSQPVLELQYITNIDENRTVAGISFPEAPDFSFMATEYPPNNSVMTFFSNNTTQQIGEAIGKYRLHKVYVYMENYFQEDWKGEMELHTAQIMLSDGSTFETDLGKILLYSEEVQDDTLKQLFASSSNQNTSATSYEASEPVKLIAIESPLLQSTAGTLELIVDGQQYYSISDLEYNKGESLNISSRFYSMEGFEDVYDEYDVRPKLNYETEDGTIRSLRIYNVTKRKYFYGFWDLLKYLLEREVF